MIDEQLFLLPYLENMEHDQQNQTEEQSSEKNYARTIQRIFQYLKKLNIKSNDNLGELIEIVNETYENKKNQIVYMKKEDLKQILSFLTNWKELIKIELENQKKKFENVGEQDETNDQKKNIPIPKHYIKHCRDVRNKDEYISLNLHLYKIILQIYCRLQLLKDQQKENRKNVNKFFDNFFASPKVPLLQEVNTEFNKFIVEIGQWENVLKNYPKPTEKALCKEDFKHILQIKKQEYLTEFEVVLEASGYQHLLGFVNNLSGNNGYKQVRNNHQSKKDQLKNKVKDKTAQIINDQDQEMIQPRFQISQEDNQQEVQKSSSAGSKNINLEKKINQGLNFFQNYQNQEDDDIPLLLLDYFEKESEDQNQQQDKDDESIDDRFKLSQQQHTTVNLQLKQNGIQEDSIPQQQQQYLKVFMFYLGELTEINTQIFNNNQRRKKLLNILSQLEVEMIKEPKLDQQNLLKQQKDFEQCLIQGIEQIQILNKYNVNLGQFKKESGKLLQDFMSKIQNLQIKQNQQQLVLKLYQQQIQEAQLEELSPYIANDEQRKAAYSYQSQTEENELFGQEEQNRDDIVGRNITTGTYSDTIEQE